MGVGPDEGLALFDKNDVASNPDIFLAEQPPNTTGEARRLNPDANYIACRWDTSATPRSFLRTIKVRVTANGKTEEARPVDFGPSTATGRVADLSPGLEKKLGLQTDDVCTVEIPTPQVGVAVGVNLAAIDKIIFPADMTRSLVVMTTSNNSTYWITNQIGSIEGGQTLLRRVGHDAPEILLSNTTVFPVQADDEIPQAVADQLNRASVDPEKSKKKGGPAPGPNTDINAKVFAKAKASVGMDTSKVPGTGGGNLACAWAVNEVVRQALGKPIAADSKGRNALGTGQVFDALRKITFRPITQLRARSSSRRPRHLEPCTVTLGLSVRAPREARTTPRFSRIVRDRNSSPKTARSRAGGRATSTNYIYRCYFSTWTRANSDLRGRRNRRNQR